MAASRKLESKIIDLRIGFWSHRFSTKQWNLNLPPTLSQIQIAIHRMQIWRTTRTARD